MANKRTYQLADATSLTGMYLSVDKSGNTDSERYLAEDLIALAYRFILRCETETVSAGTTTIEFTEPFAVGTDYAITPIWGVTADGDQISITPTDLDENGFDVTVDAECTFTYTAIIKR